MPVGQRRLGLVGLVVVYPAPTGSDPPLRGGSGDLGEGDQEIVEGHPPNSGKLSPTFTEAWQANNVVDLTFVPKGSGTRTIWAMSGTHNFFGRLLWKLMGESSVGGDLEKGLLHRTGVAEPAEEVAAKKAAESVAATGTPPAAAEAPPAPTP